MTYIVSPELAVSRLRVSDSSMILFLKHDCIGKSVRDPDNKSRLWTVRDAFAPEEDVAAGNSLGVRFRCIDARGFVTFINQRDLEVLLGYGKPGERIPWSDNRYYVSVFSEAHWVGFQVQKWDSLNDLHLRETAIRIDRGYGNAPIPMGATITRLIHMRDGQDLEVKFTCVGNADRHSGYGPDTQFGSVEYRWNCVEKTTRV